MQLQSGISRQWFTREILLERHLNVMGRAILLSPSLYPTSRMSKSNKIRLTNEKTCEYDVAMLFVCTNVIYFGLFFFLQISPLDEEIARLFVTLY